MAAKCILLSSVSRHLDGAVECVVDCHVMSLSDITRHWHCTAIPIDPQFASQWICHQFFKPQIFLLKSWKNCFQFLIQRAIHSYKHLNELSQNLNCSLQEETQSRSLREKESRVCVWRVMSVRDVWRDDGSNAGDLSHRSQAWPGNTGQCGQTGLATITVVPGVISTCGSCGGMWRGMRTKTEIYLWLRQSWEEAMRNIS